MNLTPHFTLSEMTATTYPELQDTPSPEAIASLVYLCAMVLEPLREKWGKPIHINSGYRSKSLNNRVGGVANSYHLKGLAADIRVQHENEAKQLLNVLKTLKHVDVALIERLRNSVWVHVQTSFTPRRKFFS